MENFDNFASLDPYSRINGTFELIAQDLVAHLWSSHWVYFDQELVFDLGVIRNGIIVSIFEFDQ